MSKFCTMYCRECGWRYEAPADYAMVNVCSQCGHRGLHFIRFDERERADAERFLNMQLGGPSIASPGLTVFKGVRVVGKPDEEVSHFMPCGVCGQIYDMRDLGDVLYHEEMDHKPRVRS